MISPCPDSRFDAAAEKNPTKIVCRPQMQDQPLHRDQRNARPVADAKRTDTLLLPRVVDL